MEHGQYSWGFLPPLHLHSRSRQMRVVVLLVAALSCSAALQLATRPPEPCRGVLAAAPLELRSRAPNAVGVEARVLRLRAGSWSSWPVCHVETKACVAGQSRPHCWLAVAGAASSLWRAGMNQLNQPRGLSQLAACDAGSRDCCRSSVSSPRRVSCSCSGSTMPASRRSSRSSSATRSCRTLRRTSR